MGIAEALERLEATVRRRPGFGAGTASAVTVLADGLQCSTEDGPWTVTADLPTALGGTGSAPSPSVLLRAAFGSCMAMSYRLRAARRGVDLGAIRVTVESDSALAGMLDGDADVPAGFIELRYHVEVTSTAARREIIGVIDEGDRLSPLLDTLTRTTTPHRTVTIVPGGN